MADSEPVDSVYLEPPMIVIDHDAGRSQATTLIDSEGDAIIAQSDPILAASRQEYLQLMNSLHGTGVRSEVDIPTIAVVGNQSSGKSSLIRAISGVNTPRDPGLCTRVPMECHLLHSEDCEWSCRVTLRIFQDSDGQIHSPPLNVSFGDPLYESSKKHVEDRLRRAQLSLLTPTKSPQSFLQGRLSDLGTGDVKFSTNLVSLEIKGPHVEDLSFVDLPGIIRNVGTSGNSADIQKIEDLVRSYISKPSCIILLTVACETDFANSEGFSLARECDPEGIRTVGVLTKADRIDRGEEEQWLKRFRNETEPLESGWFCVKQPDAEGLLLNTSWNTAREQEYQYFGKTEPWASLPREHRERLGTKNLTRTLSQVLSDLIMRRLPDLRIEVDNLLETTQRELESLPQRASGDAVGQVVNLIQNFAKEVKRQLTMSGDNESILQQIRTEKTRFRREMRGTAPDFRPWKSDAKVTITIPVPDFLKGEDDDADGATSSGNGRVPAASAGNPVSYKPIFADDVARLAQRSSSRELLTSYPPSVQDHYIRCIADGWEKTAKDFVARVYKILTGALQKIIEAHFSQYASGGIQLWVISILSPYFRSAQELALEHIDLILRSEKIVDTGNARDIRIYKDLYLTHYKMFQGQSADNSFIKNLSLKPYNPDSKYEASTDFRSGEKQLVQAAAKMGLSLQTKDLAKLQPSNAMEPALEVMATVSAYFQVSLNRFTDYAALFVDLELVQGLKEDILEEKLRRGINLSDPDTVRRCEQFLQEAQSTAEYRRELEMRLGRLREAYTRLQSVYIG